MSRHTIPVLVFAVLLVLVPSLLVAQSLLPLYTGKSGKLVIDRMYGGDLDDPDNFFYLPVDIALDSNDNLFVLDNKAYCIKKFAPDGTLLKTFGRKGEGPGEMIGAYSMAVDPDGNVLVFDVMNSRRFSFYDNQGNFLKAVSLTEFGFKNITGMAIAPRGDLLVSIKSKDYFKPDSKTIFSVARFDLETRQEQPIDSVAVRDMYTRQDGQTWQMASVPFHPDLLWGIAPSGNIVVADSDTYRIRIYSPEYKLLYERTLTGRERPVTQEDKDDYFDSFNDDNLVEWLKKKAEFPGRMPWFDRLYIDHEGYILLKIDDIGDDTQLYDVLDPTGERINTIELPKLGGATVFSKGYIYTTGLHDEQDYVVYRYRLE